MIADMLKSKILNKRVAKLFIRRKRINYFSCFYLSSYLAIRKSIRLNSTDYFVMKIPNKGELQ